MDQQKYIELYNQFAINVFKKTQFKNEKKRYINKIETLLNAHTEQVENKKNTRKEL